MIVLRILAYLLGLFGLIGTVLPFLNYDDYWIRGFDYPRPQLVFILFLAAILWLVTNTDWDRYDYIISALLIACFSYQTVRMIPYTKVYSVQSQDAVLEVTPESSLSLMVCNVLQTNKEYDRVINLALETQPDIFLTLESDQAWQDALHQGLAEAYPYHVDVPLENYYGMHLFSKLELHKTKVKYRIKEDIPSIDTYVVLGNGEEVDLYCLHPMPPSPSENYASTGRDAELAQVGLAIRDNGRNSIVLGDLNDVAWSHTSRLFRRISGLLDPRQGRGLFATFHADHWWARWPLDHIYHSEDLALVDLRRLDHIGSDHFPVYTKFNFEPGASEGKEDEVRQGDFEESKEMIEHGEKKKDDVLIPQKE